VELKNYLYKFFVCFGLLTALGTAKPTGYLRPHRRTRTSPSGDHQQLITLSSADQVPNQQLTYLSSTDKVTNIQLITLSSADQVTNEQLLYFAINCSGHLSTSDPLCQQLIHFAVSSPGFQSPADSACHQLIGNVESADG
jgi:hypothetical protein